MYTTVTNLQRNNLIAESSLRIGGRGVKWCIVRWLVMMKNTHLYANKIFFILDQIKLTAKATK
jgi:hypothetical protein